MVKIRICPKCKSASIREESTRGMNFIAGIQPLYICKKCGYTGAIFPEIDEKELYNIKNEKD
ncbi:hypothetical protein JW930_06845 [Candidatus Woesearchaeota archaeon]|nr:hypothetical protein [Candidatus Woesearchaeota archaeon]